MVPCRRRHRHTERMSGWAGLNCKPLAPHGFTPQGSSVLEMVKAFEKASGKKVEYKVSS